MNTLKQKLKELEGTKKRDDILEGFTGEFRTELEAAPFSILPKAEYFAAYPTQQGGKTVASRGNLPNWSSLSFQDLEQASGLMATLNIPSQTFGWLAFESSTPNFYIKGLSIKLSFHEVARYLINRGDFDVKWTGEELDCGFIIEQYNQKGSFEFSRWGF